MTSGKTGIPFVIAAPSGTGKTTVCRQVEAGDPQLVFSVSHTTRAIRSGEVDGRDYHFVDRGAFERLIAEDAFLEWAEYNGNHYGTSWRAVRTPLERGLDVILEIEVQGARQVRRRMPEARLIFLLPPDLAELESRLRGRGTNTDEEIEARLDTARRELQALPEFDYAVVNDELMCCVEDVREIVAAERTGDAADARRRFDPQVAGEKLLRTGSR